MIFRGDMLRLHQTFNFTHARTRSASDSHYRCTRSPRPAWLGRRPSTSRALGRSERASARWRSNGSPAQYVWISVDKERPDLTDYAARCAYSGFCILSASCTRINSASLESMQEMQGDGGCLCVTVSSTYPRPPESCPRGFCDHGESLNRRYWHSGIGPQPP